MKAGETTPVNKDYSLISILYASIFLILLASKIANRKDTTMMPAPIRRSPGIGISKDAFTIPNEDIIMFMYGFAAK